MKADGESRQPEEQSYFHSLAFSGKITASVTHELKNVLGTIDQVNGLIEDLIEFGASDPDALPSKLENISERIIKQVERGSQLIDRLNAFAHMSDYGVGSTDIRSLVENITALSQRLAGLRKVELKVALPDDDVAIITSPFLFAQLYFAVVFAAIGVAKPESIVDIVLAEKADGAEVSVSVNLSELSGEISEIPEITLLCEQLAARIEESIQDTTMIITIAFPDKI
jgi:signal transduction histidine kinase